MALIVQTIDGLSDADAYVSQAAFETHCENRNRDLADYGDEAIEAAIREATQYIDIVQRYKAVTLVDGQSTEFPRDGLTDWSGRTVTGIPTRVVNACCELAWSRLLAGADLFENLDRGGRITSESVGPISVSYAFDAPAGKVYIAAMNLLKPFARGASDAFAPYIGGSAGTADNEPLFDFGMHQNNDD